MPTISTPDGETWHLTPEQREALADLLAMPPDHLRALRDLAEQQIAISAITPSEFGARLPIFSEDGLPIVPISCRPRIMAIAAEQDPPRCTWRRDKVAGGFSCKHCARWLRPRSVYAVEVEDVLAARGGDGDE